MEVSEDETYVKWIKRRKEMGEIKNNKNYYHNHTSAALYLHTQKHTHIKQHLYYYTKSV